MSDRNHLVLLRPGAPVCADCPALIPEDCPGPLCPRCSRYRQIDRIVGGWPSEAREHVLGVIHAVVTMLPPDDGREFFRLLAEIVGLDH